MSHLIEEYAKNLGVKIGKPVFHPHFVPIPFEKYIAVHNSSIQAKNYSYWNEIVDLLRPILNSSNIKIVQILDKDQGEIAGVDYSLFGDYKQLSFVISNCMMFVGGDGYFLHAASYFDTPMVGIYSNSNPLNCGPVWSVKNPPIILESPKNGKKWSYSNQENPKTIDSILPETIAQEILNALKIKKTIKRKTLYIGERYMDRCVDIVPRKRTNFTSDKINVRMDLFHDEAVLKEILDLNFVEITTANPVSDNILNMRKIGVINYVSPKFDIAFVEKVRSLGITINLLCTSKDNLSSERLKLFDFAIIDFDLPEKIRLNSEKVNYDSLAKFKIKSNKKIVCGNKVFDSLYHYTNMSRDAFFLDLEWCMVYSD